jgi:hypothetical protein
VRLHDDVDERAPRYHLLPRKSEVRADTSTDTESRYTFITDQHD